MKLEWLTHPPAEAVVQALSALIVDGVVDEHGGLTQRGAQVAEIPLEVKLACMVTSSSCIRVSRC